MRTPAALLKMARGIVLGMKYLASMNFVHRVSVLQQPTPPQEGPNKPPLEDQDPSPRSGQK